MYGSCGLQICLANPGLWMRISRSNDGTDHNQYVLLYVNNYLVASEQVSKQVALMRPSKYFPLKPELVGPPKLYLDGKLSSYELPNGVVTYVDNHS